MTCTFFNLIGAIILAWLFNQSFSFAQLTHKSFLVNAVQTKLAKSDWQNFFEGITANMFVFLINEHLIANFASFMLAAFSSVEHIKGLEFFNVIRQWIIVFFGNWIGGGIFIGLAYAWLNQTKTPHKE